MIGIHFLNYSPEEENADLRARIEKLKVGKKALRNERDFLRRKHLEALAKNASLKIIISRMLDYNDGLLIDIGVGMEGTLTSEARAALEVKDVRLHTHDQ